MTHTEFSLYSASLGTWSPVTVLLPYNKNENTSVIYMLHGLGCDYRKWSALTCLERYAEGRNAAIVMPYGQRSFYCDMKHGYKYYTYIADELPQKMAGMFGLAPNREHTFIAGLSMGGYGAVRIGFSRPEQYAGVCAMSGVLDPVGRLNGEWWDEDAKLIWGEDYRTTMRGTDDDLIALTDKLSLQDIKPKVFHTCGTEDFLYEDNQTFRKNIENKGFNYEYHESPGEHAYAFWDRWLPDMFDFLLK